jgi:hypothetical protein
MSPKMCLPCWVSALELWLSANEKNLLQAAAGPRRMNHMCSRLGTNPRLEPSPAMFSVYQPSHYKP